MAIIEQHPVIKTIKALSPITLAILLVLFFRIPVRMDGIASYLPHISLMFGYYWILHQPSFVPPIALFTLGLVDDFATGGAFGITALILLVLQLVLNNQSKFVVDRAFAIGWVGFVFVAVIGFLVIWLLSSFTIEGGVSPFPLLSQLVVTIVAYPVFGLIFARLEQLVAS
jgi:rod shape-determining protein MreD